MMNKKRLLFRRMTFRMVKLKKSLMLLYVKYIVPRAELCLIRESLVMTQKMVFTAKEMEKKVKKGKAQELKIFTTKI